LLSHGDDLPAGRFLHVDRRPSIVVEGARVRAPPFQEVRRFSNACRAAVMSSVPITTRVSVAR
jgi:hypothetical protein